MATGDRRLGSSARRGMTVLGKIPAVPRPINLPSQRLENRGLDPSVEIVPRGTFSWGTGRSPPASSSSWGNVGLSSSPPTNTGAWNTQSKPISSVDNASGGVAQNPPRPLSAGSTRPLPAGTTRPSSASATSGRAWAGAPKLDELQPSNFSFATVDFPTLGSEKNPNLRPQQNTAPSNRPTSADATKERIPAHAGTLLNRPTSADGNKERKMVYPGVAPADRPTSADGSLVDKGRHHSDVRLPTLPPFVDGNLADQRHPLYTGVAEHGTAGPGPGTHAQFKDNPNLYPPLVQHSMVLPGSHMLRVGDIMQPGALQHDRHFNGPLALHSNTERDVLVLPVDTRPGVYNNYPMDLGPNHFDRSRVHHPQSRWGPNHLDRSGVYQSYHPAAILQIEPQPYGREAVMQHHQGNRRDGSNVAIKHFGEPRAGWDGRNVVLIGSSTDTPEPSVPTPGSGREPQNPDMFTTSWGHEPKHSGWGNSHRGDTSMGTCRVGPPSAMVEQTALLPGGPGDTHREGKGAGHTGEIVHSISSRGSDAGKFGANSSVLPLGASLTGMASELPSKEVTEISSSLRPSVQFHKQEDSVKSLMANTRNFSSEVLKERNETWVNGSSSGSSPSAGMQPLKIKQEDERNRAEQSKEPQRVRFVSNMAKPRQEVNWHDNLQSKNSTHIVDTDNQNGPAESVKNINAKKEMSISQRSTKGNRKDDSFPSQLPPSKEPHHASEMFSSKSSEVNGRTSSSAALSTSSGKDHKSDVSSGVQVSSDGTKEASADAGSSAASGAVQARSPPPTESEDASVGDHKAIPTAESSFMAPVVEILSLEEEGQALIDDSNSKARRNTHPSRRAQHGRSIHEFHLVDKQHVNHGMVWAPVKTPTVGTTNQANTEKAGIYQEPTQHTSTEIDREKPMQPLQKHQPSESRGQRPVQQVQQTQSAAVSKTAQGQQGQEHTVVSNKKQVQQGHHHKVETSSKQQGKRVQPQQSRTSDHNGSEKWLQQEQSTASSNKNQTPERKQSISSSHHEQEQSQSQFGVSSRSEVNMNNLLPAKEQQEKAAESRSTPVVDKLNGKKGKIENAIYVPRPARNQQRQGWEQEHGQRFAAASGQRLHSKDESSVVEDQENQPSEPSTVFVADSSESATAPVANSNKNNEEVKSRNSRFSKHQKRHQHEQSASLNAGERHASTWKKSLPEETGVNSSGPSSVTEHEANEESKTGPSNPVRHQEMRNKQSAAGSHQEYIHIAGENKRRPMETPDTTSCESSTIKSEMKLYIPKHRKEKTHQQVSAASGYEGLKGQEGTLEEAQSLSNEKDQQDARSPQLSGVGTNTKKDGIELYTPKPARQSNMQGHQSSARGNRRQKVVDLVEGQAVRGSSSQATVASPSNKDKEIVSHAGVPDLTENNDNWQSCGAENRADNRLHAPYESSQGKKEAKLYVARPARQHQQPVVSVDPVHAEVPNREEGPLSERAHQMPGTEPSKRKEEMKRYTPKPARHPTPAQSPAVLEAKEREDIASLQDQEQQRSESEGRASESEHAYKNKNHPSRPRKSANALSRSQMKSQPPLEDGAVDDHTARVDEANEAITYKEAKKDRESGLYQKRGSRPRNHDTAENPTSDETEIVRPRQYPKQPHYQYQPVTQHPQTGKLREEESNAEYDQKFNNRHQDHGQNRYREGPPRRGRPHGYNYRAAEYAG